jgi:hypothetical protein
MKIPNSITFLLFFSFALLMVGCSKPVPEVVDTSEPLYFERIGMGQTGLATDTIEVLIRDKVAWMNWSKRVTPLESFADVDFSQTMVALIAIPEESGGYTVEVESVELDGGEITVSYLLSKPKIECVSPLARALPFQAVLVRRAEGEARFERREEYYGCTL